jgi:class 3 adenylate cyclase
VKADPATEAEILALCERGSLDLDAGNIDGYFSGIAPDEDVVLYGTGADEKLIGRDSIRVRVPRQVEEASAGYVRVDWHSVSLSRDGSVAWVAMDCTSTASINGAYLTYPVRFTGVLERRDGRWLFVQQHSSIPGHPEGTSYPTGLDAVVSAVELERPRIAAHSRHDGTVTLLFTDIENSTQIALRLGDKAWMETLRFHNAVIRRHTIDFAGIEVKSQGDGFMLAFKEPAAALTAAIHMQREFGIYNARNADEPIRVRMGAHLGDTIEEDNDFFGANVILASRLVALARPGEILISERLKSDVEASGAFAFGSRREMAFKGFAGTHTVHPLVCVT